MKSSNCGRSRVLSFGLVVVLALGSAGRAATQVEIDAAIQKGIEWLIAQQNADGSWLSWVEDNEYQSSISPTAFAVIKLGEYAQELGYDSPFNPNYAYHEAIDKGMRYVFENAHVVDINSQPVGNPDSDGDGLGVYFSDSVHLWEETYNTGIVMMAIAATRSPDRIVMAPSSPVDGWTYKQVLQDTVDYMAFGQTDEPPGRGGWGYTANGGDWDEDEPSSEPCTTYSDNSNTGFVVLGLAYAESAAYGFNCVVPQFVRDEVNIWIDYIQSDDIGLDGGSGYDAPNEWVNALKTGNLIFEMSFCGDGPGVPRMQRALEYLARMWNHPTNDPGWKGPPPQYQAIYCLMKGLEYRGIDGILVYPVAQRIIFDVDMFEVTGLGTAPVDIEVVEGYFDSFLGLFDGGGNLIATDDDGGFDELSRLAGVTPEAGTVRFGITGCCEMSFEGNHMETGPYRTAVWPSGSAAPNEPQVTESESNDQFAERDVFASPGQLVINGELGISEYFPPEGEPVVIDWYQDLANVIVSTQNPDGSWPGDMYNSGDSVLTTAWALLTLEKVTPPVAMVYGQCILAGESFEPVSLDDAIDPNNPGTPPYTWTVMGNVELSVEIDANNVMSVTCPPDWTGSETLTLICVDAANQTYIIPYPNPTYAVCAQPVVLNIPDQKYPFEPFDLDDYICADCGLDPQQVEWSVSGVSEGWSVQIDANNVSTVAAQASVSGSATFTFTAVSTACICGEPSASDSATFVAGDAVVEVNIDIDPDTLNPESKGCWITCYIRLGESYNVVDIDPESLMLQDQIAADRMWFDEQEQVAMAKFSRSAVQAILEPGSTELTLTGALIDGTIFEGKDTITVIDKAGDG